MALVPIEGRIDVQDLAMIIEHFENQDMILESKSQLLRYIVSAFATILFDNGLVKPVTEEDALRTLKSRFILSDRGKRGVQKALQDIHISADNLDSIGLPTLRGTKAMMNDAMEAMRRLEKESGEGE